MDVSVRDGRSYEFGPFRLDPARRTLSCGGEPVAITPTVFEALLCLVERPGRVVTRDELMDAVWPRRTVEEANLSQTIFTLRRVLAAAGAAEPYIVTHSGRGYRFTQAVTVRGRGAPAEPAAPAPPMATAPAVLWGPGRGRVRMALALAAAAAALAAAAGGWWWLDRPAPAPRVVVLGEFQNLTGDPLFDRTFTEAARVELQQSPSLSVLPERRVQDTLALMTRPPDAALTAAVAQEVCARNGGLAVVRGSVAQVGARYLLTLTAEDCAGGDTLAAEKAEAVGRDGLLPALDGLAGRLRRRLGESAASLRSHSTPLPLARTASFEALRAYAEGRHAFESGRRADAIPLYRQALELDPNFAAAHADLAITLYDMRAMPEAVREITEARRLSGAVDARERLFIRYQYNAIAARDLDEGVAVLKSWTQLFPGDAGAWANLANAETWRGRPAAAIAPGRRAVALEPAAEAAYVVLARAWLHAGRLAEAQAVCRAAAAHRVDGDDLHGLAYQVDIARGDLAGAGRELDRARGRPGERLILLNAGQAAFSRGQVRRGQALFAEAQAMGRSLGLGAFTAAPNARLLYDMGLTDLARASLAQAPADYDSADYRFTQAEFGDAARARALLKADLAASPADTLLNRVSASEVRAALALRAGRPREAAAALAPAAPYETRTFDIPYLRGQAWLAAGDGAQAAAAFRTILDNRGIEPVSVHYPLARLGLARAEVLRGDPAAARTAYQAFFADWQDADPDMPLLAEARAEFGRLPRR